MATSEYSDPNVGAANLGYTLILGLNNNSKQMVAPISTLNDNFTDEDLQKVVDALAGIPGASNVRIEQGKGVTRTFSPDRPYEPLPPPPE